MSRKIRVLLADDHSIIREGIKYILRKWDRYEFVGEAVNGLTTVELAEKLNPDIIIMDLKMPGMNGIEAAFRIRRHNPRIRMVALSGNIDATVLQQSHKAGFLGFVTKESAFDELGRALEAVWNGSGYYCMRIRGLVMSCFRNNVEPQRLSPYDQDIVRMLADGKSVGEIALFLHKSPKTIDARRRKIMNQLGLDNLAELTKYAIAEGLTGVEIFS